MSFFKLEESDVRERNKDDIISTAEIGVEIVKSQCDLVN